mmetsp:Transcript_22622/g.27304  ORF Transcript_22622/g.27304 Transcript_22622/m.27304 type:complete len:84 (+) Transcript_22622:151-402(+)|eukprot:CAMPEP_0197847684 /NCGR_PEP_ID=MMETSP1438-20131217/6793_1 /TAXON_ID=1461541 /ORGANISM="Pterosperma sp., Strain CCMP1384" /LENGTH=83 /DNA_ID=CAMNT_0043459677 /DNA_START=151 /DNA_END=402 /DNA_ORIENTATION=-
MEGGAPQEEEMNTRAAKALNSTWKHFNPEVDHTPKMSTSQELLAYIPPAEDTVPTGYRIPKGVFGQYLDKAVRLKVNLKSTAH